MNWKVGNRLHMNAQMVEVVVATARRHFSKLVFCETRISYGSSKVR